MNIRVGIIQDTTRVLLPMLT